MRSRQPRSRSPAEQGPCVSFYGGNSTNFYTSAIGSFTTPKLGKIVVAGKGTVAGKKATLTINDESVEKAAGTIVLTGKKGSKTVTVASGKFSVPAGATGTASLKLTSAGSSLLKKSKKLVTKITLTSTTDQPSPSKTVTLSQSSESHTGSDFEGRGLTGRAPRYVGTCGAPTIAISAKRPLTISRNGR